MTDLQLVSRLDAHTGYVSLGGELRLELGPRVYAAGRELLSKGARHLVVDVGGVTFMDSASLGVLIRLETEVVASEGRFVLVDIPPAVDRVLTLAALSERFVVAENESAARALLT